MDDDFEKLKLLKAEQISEKTHITKSNIINILSKSFDKFDKIQFNGFVSILEREYSLNLQALRDEYLEYAKNHDDAPEPNLQTPFKQNDQPRGFLWILILAIVVIVAWFIYASVLKPTNHKPANTGVNATSSAQPNTASFETNSTNATAVASVNATLKPLKPITVTATKADNKSKNLNQPKRPKKSKNLNQPKQPKKSSTADITLSTASMPLQTSDKNATITPKRAKSVKLFTKAKLWLGITNMRTWKQQQKIVTSSLDLNASGDYLLILGHGMVQIQTEDKNTSFSQTKMVFLMLKNGIVTQLSRNQFSKLNKGKLW